MRKFILLFLFFAYVVFPPSLFAQTYSPTINHNEEIVTARVTNIVKEEKVQFDNRPYLIQTLRLAVTKGSLQGKQITVTTNRIPISITKPYNIGQSLLVGYYQDEFGDSYYYIIDHDRSHVLLFLTGLFLVLLFVITRKRGVMALLGMIVSFMVIFLFMLPHIIKGYDPLLVTLLATVIIIPITFYLTHGVKIKTHIAVVSTVITLGITGVLAKYVLDAATISGISIEELEIILQLKNNLSLSSLLLSGMLVALLGVLDDVTITQASFVEQLKTTAKKISLVALYKKAMAVGHDHIASVVNTLILVYAGASLPLLFLILEYPRPIVVLLNSEVIALEIITALVTTIGLILAIPITTLLASYWYTKKSV